MKIVGIIFKISEIFYVCLRVFFLFDFRNMVLYRRLKDFIIRS